MSERAVKNGVKILEDLCSFFEADVEFLALPVEELRRSEGRAFSMKVVKDLLAIRSDKTKQEKNDAIEICKDIIENFKDDEINHETDAVIT